METHNGCLFMNGATYLMLYSLAIYLMTLYAIDKNRHAEIMSELETRHDALVLEKRAKLPKP